MSSILFDQGVPVPLRKHIQNDNVSTLYELGWSTMENGELITKAESMGFDVFVTTDKNLRYQQNLTGRQIAIAVLPTTNWPTLRKHIDQIVKEIKGIAVGGFIEVSF